MKITHVGVGLAKNVFAVHSVDRKDQPVWRRRLGRSRWVDVLTETVELGGEVGMEACDGAHHWARELQARGFTMKLMAAQFVKPQVKSSKNDRNDAEAVCEAISRPTMRFVSMQSVEQQDLQAVHRVRTDTL